MLSWLIARSDRSIHRYEFENLFRADTGKFSKVFGDISTPYAVTVNETLAWY
jgi:rRNA processing protein Gar1